MKIDDLLSVQQALERGAALPWALVRSLSRVTLGPVPADVDTDELIEARFFGPDQEVRLFQTEDGLRAVQLTAEPDDSTIEQVRPIADPAFGGSVTVIYTLQADEDGQMNIAYTRLAGWEDAR